MSKTHGCAALLGAVLAIAGCSEEDASDEWAGRVLQGVVTSSSGALLDRVRVNLQSTDNLAPRLTDVDGYYRFEGVRQEQNLILQFQRDGYATQTVTLSVQPGADRAVLDVSTALEPAAPAAGLDVPVAGWIYAGANPAAGATVLLTDGAGNLLHETTTTAAGRFSFPRVALATYVLLVPPFDEDGDTIYDYQFFQRTLEVSTATTANLSNVVVALRDANHDLVGSSFVHVNAPYPITAAQLASGGVSGMLQADDRFWLHFGAEVDAALTTFELVAIEAGGTRRSAPLPIEVSWQHGVIATVTPAAPLEPLAMGAGPAYELRIPSLVFHDGTVAILPPASVGLLRFTVQSAPPQLAPNPIPSLSLRGAVAGDRVAALAIPDAATVRLVDANGDLVSTWSALAPMRLEWPHVPGAVRYRVWARNTTARGNGTAPDLQWRELPVAIAPFDPNANGTIFASGVDPWAAGLGYLSPSGVRSPWLFGNGVELAVTSEDFYGFQSAIDPLRALPTADAYGGRVTAVSELASAPERGNAFSKRLRLTFSEPMLTVATAVPTLATLSANVVLREQAWSFGNGGAAVVPPPNVALDAFVELAAAVRGPCTELVSDRLAGDTSLPVRDSSPFRVGAAERIVVLDGASGNVIDRFTGVLALDGVHHVVRTVGAFTVPAPARSLACSVDHPDAAAVASVAPGDVELTVANPAPLRVGQAVLVHEPGVASDVRAIAQLDTSTGVVRLGTPLTPGHTDAARLVPIPALGGEYVLRDAAPLPLARDVFGEGPATPTVVAVTGPAPGLMIGDLVLFDTDGLLETTADRFEATVTQLRFAPPAGSTAHAFEVSLPAGTVFTRGRSLVLATGDAFAVSGAVDTSVGGASRALDAAGHRFTAGGRVF